MNALMLHELRKFLLLLVPNFVLANLSALPAAIVITLIPYTPINLFLFVSIFLLVYFTGIFGLSQKDSPFCRYNKLEQKREFSLWITILNSYKIYFIAAFILNYNTIFVYQTQQSNVFGAI